MREFKDAIHYIPYLKYINVVIWVDTKNIRKKKMLGKIHLPHFKRPHLPHMKTEAEKHNEILANMEWEDWRKEQ